MRTNDRIGLGAMLRFTGVAAGLAVMSLHGANAGGMAGFVDPASAGEPLAAVDSLSGVLAANPKIAGTTSPDVLSAGLSEFPVARGAYALENPSGLFTNYGYNGDGPMLPAYGDVQTAIHNIEASKTEPDKNTYLKLEDQTGADLSYDYGKNFLFQGHESGFKNASGDRVAYLTRINLDADIAHRVTLLATTDRVGNPLPAIDGSTWNPFAKRLLFTSENGTKGGVWQATLDVPSIVEDLAGSMGRGGYEGVQNDSDGNVWIIEDVGGSKGTVNNKARQPNSFLYRFVPASASDLTQGKLQALQVMSIANPGQPIRFHAGQADADILSQDVRDLHTYGNKFSTRWVTIHDTNVNGTAPFDANAAAKAAGATPFKRPENGQFRPGTDFREFYFDETGDTDILTQAGSNYGGFGSVLKLSQSRPSADTGTLSLFYLGDAAHTGFDNVAFWSKDEIVFVEDAGDTLHTQRNALDSAFLFNVRRNYALATTQPPTRILAQGRDEAATLDSGFLGLPGYQNDGDNEITGFHVSNGNAGKDGILGAKEPKPFRDGWRVFYTQQHGTNTTFEIIDEPLTECSSLTTDSAL
jgi:hypothetical protein